MKKIFILCSMAAAMFSCSKFTQEHDGQTVELGGREEVTVSFDFEGLDDFATKATATPFESNIKTVEIFAFYNDKLVAHYPRTEYSASAPAPSLTVLSGDHVFCAVVNQPSLGNDDIVNLKSLREKSFTFNVSTVNSTYLPMYGESTNITISSSKKTVPITLTRNVTKIVVGNITAAFSGLYVSSPVTLKSLYIRNVNEKYYLSSMPSTPEYSWKNTSGSNIDITSKYYYSFSSVNLTSDSQTATHTLNKEFYLCPYLSSSSTKTMLAITFTFLGHDYTLTHTFDSLYENSIYDIKEIKLKGTGTEVSATISLSTSSWNDVTVGTSGVIELGKLK